MKNNLIENKYPVLAKGTNMFITPQGINISLEIINNGIAKFSFFGINESGRKIVNAINGMKTTNDYILAFCEQYDISFSENKDWIVEFLFDLEQKKVLNFFGTPYSCKIHENIESDNRIYPSHATIEVTNKCNLECKHCYLNASPQKNDTISFDKIELLLKELKDLRVMNIELTGGEIFMHPEYYKIIKSCLEKFAIVGILTNGTIFDDKLIPIIEKYKEKVLVNISLDSVNPNIHDTFRGKKGSFNKTIKNIEKYVSTGVLVRIASSITNENMWEIDKLAHFSRELGVKTFSYNFVENFGRGKDFYQKTSTMNEKESQSYIEYINNVLEKYNDIIPIIDRSNYVQGRYNCGAGSTSIVIGANGNIRPCVLSPASFSIGNIYESSIKKILSSSKAIKISQILQPSLNNSCSTDCKHLTTCTNCYIKAFNVQDEENKCNWLTENKYNDIYEFYGGDKNENN